MRGDGMKKRVLDVEALRVETFAVTDTHGDARGTVFAAGTASLPPYCISFTCGDSQVRPCLY